MTTKITQKFFGDKAKPTSEATFSNERAENLAIWIVSKHIQRISFSIMAV